MKLTRIELRGFKSFCDHTRISFKGAGISVIVGPNGCGKSNVVDAIRWALGEQSARNLRGQDMSDVIFAGSTTREPLGMASVMIYFDNTTGVATNKYSEFSEICVGRRIYRDGTSEYLINNTPSRLKDIRELFLDTGVSEKGYSIIEQGTIGRIVTSRPEERRVLIEEAAGTLLFKTRKKEAQRKLDEAKANLARVSDLLGELSERHEQLSHQVDRAEKFIRAKSLAEKTYNEIESYQWQRLTADATKMKLDIKRIEEDEKAVVAQLSNAESLMQAAVIRQTILEKDVESIRYEIDDARKDINAKESELKMSEQELSHLDKWKEREHSDIAQAEDEKKEKLKALTNAKTEAAELEKMLKSLSDGFEKRKNYNDEFKAKVQDLEDLLRQQRTQLSNKSAAISEANARLQALEEKIAAWDIELAKTRAESSEAQEYSEKEKGVAELKAKIESDKELLEEQRGMAEDCREDIQMVKAGIHEAESEESKAKSAIRSLEAEMLTIDALLAQPDTTDDSVRLIHEHFSDNPEERRRYGLIGRIGGLFSLSENADPGVIAAWESVKDIYVFESAALADEIHALLNQHGIKLLRAYFLDRPPRNPPRMVKESYRPLSDFLKAMPDAVEVGLLDQMFSSGNAKWSSLPESVLESGVHWFSPDGCLLSPHGELMLIGPDVDSSAKIRAEKMTRRESLDKEKAVLDEARQKAAKLSESKKMLLEELQSKAELLTENVIRLEAKMSEYAQVLRLEEQTLSKLSGERVRDTERQRSLEENIRKANNEKNNLNLFLAQSIHDKEALERSIESVEEELLIFRDKREDAEQSFFEESAVYNETKHKHQGASSRVAALENEIYTLEERVKEFRQKYSQSSQSKEAIQRKLDEAKGLLPVLLEQFSTLEGECKELIKDLEAIKTEARNHEKAKAHSFEEITRLEKEKQGLSVKKAEYDKEASLTAERLYTEFSIRPEAVLRDMDLSGFDPDKSRRMLNEQKNILRDLGNVNLEAFEEHRALNERVKFLTEQRDDLGKSIASLEDAISEIEEDTRRRFQETFDKINENMRHVFPLLFGGGSSEIVMTDPENILESGIEIIAHIPGKKLQYMTLLSGGEKALTAMALVFSIFLIKPSPFCILDEVDAPLDDVNVGRFCNVLRELNQTSQFIVITHNKVTMKSADVLIGVTMEELGASKIVSVNVAELATA